MPTFESGNWKKYSSSRILLESLIKECMNSGYSEFDFTIGGENYKKNWCNSERSYYHTFNYFSFFGWLYFILFRLKIYITSNHKLLSIIEKILSFVKIKI